MQYSPNKLLNKQWRKCENIFTVQMREKSLNKWKKKATETFICKYDTSEQNKTNFNYPINPFLGKDKDTVKIYAEI